MIEMAFVNQINIVIFSNKNQEIFKICSIFAKLFYKENNLETKHHDA